MLVGCPPDLPLLEREAKSDKSPDLPCLDTRIVELLGEGAVTFKDEISRHSSMHAIRYNLRGRQYGFVVTTWKDGSASIYHGTWIGDSSSADVRRARSELREIEWQLRDQCGLGAILDQAKERCRGEGCAQAA
jgi:hypothetical protein